jgi:hypothetical protein
MRVTREDIREKEEKRILIICNLIRLICFVIGVSCVDAAAGIVAVDHFFKMLRDGIEYKLESVD